MQNNLAFYGYIRLHLVQKFFSYDWLYFNFTHNSVSFGTPYKSTAKLQINVKTLIFFPKLLSFVNNFERGILKQALKI